MSEELKISIPLFNTIEEAELENKLLFHLDELTNEIIRTVSKDKDIIILKKVIEKQQKEIEALEIIHNTYKEMIEENNYIDKAKIREKIKELEECKLKDEVDEFGIHSMNWAFADKIQEYLKELLGE